MSGKKGLGRIPYLLYAIIVVLLISTVTLSRYLTTVSGSGSADVASMVLNGTEVAIDVSGICPGDSRTLLFSVSNDESGDISDVIQSYTITLETTDNIPLTFSLSSGDAAGTDHALTPALTSENNIHVWTGGALPHTTGTVHNYTLTVAWPSGESDPKYAKEVDAVRLTVDSVQQY